MGLELLHVSTTNTLNLLAILENHKGGHGVHAQVLCHGLQLVHVHLDKPNVWVLLAELSDDGGNGLAGTTPRSEEVDDDGAGGGEGFEDDGAVGRMLELDINCAEDMFSYLSISETFPWAMMGAEEFRVLRNTRTAMRGQFQFRYFHYDAATGL